MRLGMIGLGRMGANMTRRLRGGDIEVVGFDHDPTVVSALAGECGMSPGESVEHVVAQLHSPRVVWLMLPAGAVTEAVIAQTAHALAPGDIIVDGANSNFNDSIRRAEILAEREIDLVDAGVSGGIWGLQEGYTLMAGGKAAAVTTIRPIFEVLAPAPDRGWMHCGPAGSGHYVKMVHNGIEYGMMQAYAEGFALLKSREDFDVDLAAVAETWRPASVVRSWLLDLTAEFLADDQQLEDVEAFVADSGEGRWTVIEALERGVPAPVMSAAIMTRLASQGGSDFAAKLLAMMRKGFGGHDVKKRDSE